MKPSLLLVLAVAIGLVLAGASHADPKEAADDPLPAGCTMRLGTARFRMGIPISMMSVSNDGKMAVAVNGNNMLAATKVFDMETGRVIWAIDGWEGTSIEAANISPDGKTLVTKQDFSLCIRDAQTGNVLRKIAMPRVNSFSRNEWVRFTPDGKAIAATSQGSVVHLYDAETRDLIREFANENPESNPSDSFSAVLGIAFSSDGKLMATGGFSNEKDNYFAILWDVETGQQLRRFEHGRSYGIESLAISPDGKLLATGSHDARLRLFDVETRKLLRALPKNGRSRMHSGCVAFSPDSKLVAAAGEALRVYDVASGEERWHIDRRALGLVFTDEGRTLTGAVMGAIHRWDAATGKVLSPEGGDSIVEQILISADSKVIATRGTDGDAHLWDGATGKHLRAISATWQRGMAMSPDGRFLVWPVPDASVRFKDPQHPNMIHEGSRICLYDIVADKRIDQFPAFEGDAHDLTFTSDGKELITVDHRDGMVRIWNVEAGKEERSFRASRDAEKQQSNAIWRSELSPDGKLLAVAYVLRPGQNGNVTRLGRGSDETYPVRVWNMASGEETFQFDNRARYPRDLAFSPDGRWLVCSGSASDRIGPQEPIAVWDALTGETATTLPAGASAVAFSPDGRSLATATTQGAVQVWDVATWSMSSDFTGPIARVTALAFDPTRPLLFSGSADTTVLAWDFGAPKAAD